MRRWNTVLPADSDGFMLTVSATGIDVYAYCRRGFLYGYQMVQELSEQGELRAGLLLALPRAKFRGIKLFLPEPDNLEYFYRLVDECVRLRYNTVILELGGAMEYRRHPEINEGWIEYAAKMNAESGRANREVDNYPWLKNVVHAQNGGGKVLPQQVLRKLVAYCRARELQVIPEVPSLSHCDYLLLRHPELAERREDPIPDTYCPSNPSSYALLFDVLDEAIEVFRPTLVHIGHDEWYSIGLCPRCRGKDAARLYVDDISRIRDYLAEKGIGVMMWADKLLDAHEKGGYPLGGAERTPGENGWKLEAIPATYAAVDHLPKDIQLMHWYWNIDRRYENEFLKRGLKTVFGNLCGAELPQADKRLESGILGGALSNWGLLDPIYIRRNGVLFDLYYNASLFWKKENAFETLSMEIWRDCFTREQSDIMARPHIRVLHRAKTGRPYTHFVDGVLADEDADLLGWYEITATDGQTVRLPVVYGKHLSSADCYLARREHKVYDSYETDRRLKELTGTAIPHFFDNEIWFETVYALPFQEADISGWQWFSREGAFTQVETHSWEISASAGTCS